MTVESSDYSQNQVGNLSNGVNKVDKKPLDNV